MQIKEVLEYEDVNLEQQVSPIRSRKEISTTTLFSRNISLSLPVSSAPMATITGAEMAIAMSLAGGIGVMHRFGGNQTTVVEKVTRAGHRIVGSVGVTGDPVEEAGELAAHGAVGVVIDVAHGGLPQVAEVTRAIKDDVPGLDVIAGNVMTANTAKALEDAGADAIRVGIGPGAVCTTRNKTGVGGGQLTAVYECAQATSVPVIADGGIKEYGDILKALAAGATSVMIGSMFAGCPEVPLLGRTTHRGSAWPHEGTEIQVAPKKSVSLILAEIEAALRSGMSYLGAAKVHQIQDKAVFRKR